MKKFYTIIFILFLYNILGFSYAQIWHPLSIVPNARVECLKTYRNRLIVGGPFTYCDTLYTLGQAAWNGQYWDSIGQCCPVVNYPSFLEIINDELYFATIWHDKLVKWNNSIFTPISPIVTDNGTASIKYYKGDIYIAGNFYQLSNNLIVNAIARLHNGMWQSVNGGINHFSGIAKCMAVYKDELYVGGHFGKAGNVLTNHIARWNGSNWADVGAGLPAFGMVHTMEVDTINDFLYVAGEFYNIGSENIPALLIARWDGHKWESLGNIVDNAIYSLEFYNNQLYAGWAASNNLITDTLVAKFDGKNWQYIPGPNSYIYDMEVYKDTLYIGGSFSRVSQYLTSNLVGLYEPPPTHCNWLISRIYANSDTITLGDTMHFENNNKYATTWTWDFGDGGIDSVQKPEHVYQTSGVYAASVIVHQENCYDTAYFTVNVLQTALPKAEEKPKTYILGNCNPNPTRGTSIINYQIPPETQIAEIWISDLQGKTLEKHRISVYDTAIELDFSHLKANTYLFTLFADGKVRQSKRMAVVK